jgi:hypothetical protein
MLTSLGGEADGLAFSPFTFAAMFFLPALPIGALAIKSLNKKDLSPDDTYRASRLTILLHALGSLALTIGFVVFALAH